MKCYPRSTVVLCVRLHPHLLESHVNVEVHGHRGLLGRVADLRLADEGHAAPLPREDGHLRAGDEEVALGGDQIDAKYLRTSGDELENKKINATWKQARGQIFF